MARKSDKDSALNQSDGFEAGRNGGLILVKCHLTKVTPLLMNAMSEEQLLDIWGRVKPPKTATRPEPREAADMKVYRLADGRPHVPVKNLYAAFIAAGQFVRMDGKRQWSTGKSTNLPGALGILDVELPLFIPGQKESPDFKADKQAPRDGSGGVPWEVDIQQGRNPNGGEAVCIIRPRFNQWEVRCTLEIDQTQMPLNVAMELVNIAGRRIGLGDFRPQRKGTFGRFAVTLWQPMQAAMAA